MDIPKTGDLFACDKCGMRLLCINDCGCDDGGCVKLECCGQAMRVEAVDTRTFAGADPANKLDLSKLLELLKTYGPQILALILALFAKQPVPTPPAPPVVTQG